jgi:hypothetical protein
LDRLKGLLRPAAAPAGSTELIYIRIPEPLQPLVRGDLFEDPLDAELKLAQLGEVSGGGSQLSDLRPDGTRSIEWCGIDVDVIDVPAALELLRRELPPLGCPPGTELQYILNSAPFLDTFDGTVWDIGQPRGEFHSGFGP